MKIKCVLSFLLLFSGMIKHSAAQKNNPPVGFLKFSDKLYVSQEISYRDWFDFMINTNAFLSEENFRLTFPDTTIARTKLVFENKLKYPSDFWKKDMIGLEFSDKRKHFQIPAALDIKYADYPVTGVSYEQVQYFCTWKTVTQFPNSTEDFTDFDYSALDRKKYYKGKIDGKEVYYFWKFRLPTPNEWSQIALKNIQHPDKKQVELDYRKGVNDKGCMLLNFKKDNICDSDKEYRKKILFNGQLPVLSHFPGFLGLYNMQGNVSEMTSLKGIACGGSFQHPITDCQPESQQTYEKPEDWLGFRLVAELVTFSKEEIEKQKESMEVEIVE